MELIKRKTVSDAQFALVIQKLNSEKYFKKLEDTPNKFLDTRVRCPICNSTVYLEVLDEICIVQCNRPLCMKRAVQ